MDRLNCIKAIADFPTTYKTNNLTPIAIMEQSGYSEFYSEVTVDDIADYLVQRPDLVEDWLVYTENIRHTPAWGLTKSHGDSWIVGLSNRGRLIESHSYADKFAACAKMIKMTLEEIRRSKPV